MISFAEILGHATYLILAASYWAKDMLWLRLLTIPACLCGISFGLFYADGPIWVIVFWNVLFLGINLVQLNQIFASSNVNLNNETELLLNLLRPICHRDVRKLVRIGKLMRYGGLPGQKDDLIQEGDHSDRLFVVLRGTALILKNGQQIARCGKGTFLGDISFVAATRCSATVKLLPGTVTLAWNTDQLKRLLDQNTDLKALFTQHLAIEISRKLQRNEADLVVTA